MVKNAEQVRRPRGRPPTRSHEETRRILIEAAASEFETKGYAETSTADVAQRAGVSTRTVYRLIPNKANLLVRVASDRVGQFMLEVDAEALDTLSTSQALERILIAYGMLTLSQQTISMHRLVISECDRFLEVATAFYQLAIPRANEGMAAWLRRQCERGLIKVDDPQPAAGMLGGMMTMDPQRAVMLGQRDVPDAYEVAARAKQGARFFLDGCLVDGRRPGR
jgi:AcrR family transcriptional regulator